MSREEALKQLEELRAQLVTVYTCSEKCEKGKQEIETLMHTRDNPAPMDFTPKSESHEATLRAEFDEKNARKIRKSAGFEVIFIFSCLLLLVGICAALYFDINNLTGILIRPEMIQKPAGDYSNALILHAIFSVVTLIVVIAGVVSARRD